MGGVLNDTFYNCQVEGDLFSTNATGGITGSSSWSNYLNCEFNGRISNESTVSVQNGSGGIAGVCGGGRIVGCKVNAIIESTVQSGYIAGWCVTYGGIFKNNTYSGEILSGKGENEMFGRYIESRIW